jgi:phage shock protein E
MNVFDQLKAQMRGTPAEPLPANAVVIDVRSPAEFTMGHVEGALNIPVEAITAQTLAPLSDKTQTLVVYCASGMRSGYARSMLMQMGYTNVVNAGTPYETAQMTNKPLVR